MSQIYLIMFGCLFAVVLYALAGYPLVLGFTARRHRHPVLKDSQLRSVSFIIPVYNGERFLGNKLQSILDLNYPRELIEILVVSDGSTDRTARIALGFESQGVRLIRVERGGKPSAVNAGVPYCSGEILVLTDVRQTLHPESLRNMIACFGDPAVGAVSAQLSIREGETSAEHDTGLYWRYELWMRQKMTRIHSTWGCTGAYYAMRRSLFTPIPPDTLIDDAWLPLTAVLKGYRVILEPTAVMYDFPTTLDSEFRRKVRTLAGLFQLIWLLPGLFGSRNPMRFHYLSGKYVRLVVPWCLLGMAALTFGIAYPWRGIVLGGQSVFYLAGLIDPLVPVGFAIKKITSPIQTFIILMAAALFAIRIFFVAPRSLWKETTVCEAAPAKAD